MVMNKTENHGFQGVVAKPYDMEKLGVSIQNCLVKRFLPLSKPS